MYWNPNRNIYTYMSEGSIAPPWVILWGGVCARIRLHRACQVIFSWPRSQLKHYFRFAQQVPDPGVGTPPLIALLSAWDLPRHHPTGPSLPLSIPGPDTLLSAPPGIAGLPWLVAWPFLDTPHQETHFRRSQALQTSPPTTHPPGSLAAPTRTTGGSCAR